MSKRILWKDAWQAISRSLGRFIAIFLLMAVSAFALIGLKITGPDMRQTANTFFAQHHLADTTITSNYGLDSRDRQIIRQQKSVKQVDFGYLQDSTIDQTKRALRIFSQTNGVSSWQTVSGHLPRHDNEIAVSYLLKGKYHIGQWITLKQAGSLKHRQFKIVGFVRSSEYLDRSDIGQTTVGTGQLSGVAVVKKTAFKTGTAYAIARITYNQTAKMNPYSARYTNYVEKQQQQLKKALNRHGKTKQQKLERQLKAAQQQLTQATQQAALLQQKNAGAGNAVLIQQAAALKNSRLSSSSWARQPIR